MSLLLRIYNKLVNGRPGIRQRYQTFRDCHTGSQKILAWGYLVLLNIRFYLLRDKSIGEDMVLNPDQERKILLGSESGSFRIETQNDLIERLLKYDVISFDVFDTLLLRKVERPEDVFYMVQEKLEYPNFKNIRKTAEQKSREKRYEKYKDYEVTFKEIWEEVSRLTGISAEAGMCAEWQSELTLCYANPYFLKVVQELKKRGKTIVICSDMYLGSDHIKELLTSIGYPEFDCYYVSSDLRVSKHDGQLFARIKEDFGDSKSYIHIGDNVFSDIKQAGKSKFDTWHYRSTDSCGKPYRAKDMSGIMGSIYSAIVNNYLHCGINTYTEEYEFGFIYGGMFVVGYCQYIHRYVAQNHVDKILFLARDGGVIQKVYELLYPEDADKCRYAYWSRLASTKMCAGLMKSHYIERMVWHKVNQNYSFKKIFHTMEIDDMLPKFIREYSEKHYSEETILRSSSVEDVISFLNTHWGEVCSHYESEIAEGKRYYQELIGDAKKAVAVDVGWVGSGAIALRKMFSEVWNLSCELVGLMAGTCSGNGVDYESTAIESATGVLKSYLFSQSDNRDLWKVHDPVKGHNMIVELLLSSPEHSFRGFKKTEEGTYEFHHSIEKINAADIQDGILEYARQFKNHPWSYIEISGRDAMAPILLLYYNKEYVEHILKKSEINANIE